MKNEKANPTASEFSGATLVDELNSSTTETAHGDTVSLIDMTEAERTEWMNGNNIHNGAQFMSPDDNRTYQELCETDLKQAIVFLRDKWSEYADHEFMQSFALIHWVERTRTIAGRKSSRS